MTLDRLAEMVQEGFLDMGQRFDRLEGRMSNVESDMVEVKDQLTKCVTVSMHGQLTKRVSALEGHLGI